MREIKFRGKRKDNGKWICGFLVRHDDQSFITVYKKAIGGWNKWADTFEVIKETAGQLTGLKDKNGKEIYEGDEIIYRVPYRTTQTHTGDNIPNGSYTEPMEPGIKERGGIVVFKDGMFQVEGDQTQRFDETYPLLYAINEWDLEAIKESISWTRQNADWFDDPEEGDLQYLITECAKVKTSDELIQFLNGVEVIGNIYDNSELINKD